MGGRVSVQMPGNTAAPGTGHMDLIIDACSQPAPNYEYTIELLWRKTILDLTH